MLIEQVELGTMSGRRKKIERRLAVRCHFCGEMLSCPAEAEPWAWLKCGEVIDFYATHRAHGFHKMVGADFEFVEQD